MKVSSYQPQSLVTLFKGELGGLQPATLVILGTIGGLCLLVWAWSTGFAGVDQWFTWLHQFQVSPPAWVQLPQVANHYLLLPTLGMLALVWGLVKISPQPQPWSRAIILTILLVLLVRYLSWRLLATLNLADPVNGVLSLVLLALELQVICNYAIQLSLAYVMGDRHKQADRYEQAVQSGAYLPTVDVLIPTFNEPVFILKRTIMGCQAIAYPHKQVYLLDDSRRPEVEALAQQLGCHYITRPDRRHAKAGNLNHALPLTKGELIAVFDADFVPTTNFLTRTVGFFQNPRHALLQTYQSFYNPDPAARNLGLEAELPQEAESFSRFYQPVRDGVSTALCYGSSFVVRRKSLMTNGGFVTESVSEDYFTGVRLSAQGEKVIFLSESLSAGLSAENMTDHIAQRDRWARGSLQAFFIDSNPLTIRGLRFVQRLAHFDGLLQWFGSLARIGFLLMPLVYAYWGLMPLNSDARQFLYFFLPYFCVQFVTYNWLNLRSRSALISDVYSVAQCFPVSLSVIQTMLRPFSRGFRVTPKGNTSNRYVFHWHLAWPLVITFALTAISLIKNLNLAWMLNHGQMLVPSSLASFPVKGLSLNLVWNIYNLILLTLALYAWLDAPNLDRYNWFNLKRQVKLKLGASAEPSVSETTMISQTGMVVTWAGQSTPIPNTKLSLEIPAANLKLAGVIERIEGHSQTNATLLVISFIDLDLTQERALVELLYCRPGQWQQYQSPGELRCLWLLLKALVRPRILVNRRPQVQPVKVFQT